jgi:hypothetical protein
VHKVIETVSQKNKPGMVARFKAEGRGLQSEASLYKKCVRVNKKKSCWN